MFWFNPYLLLRFTSSVFSAFMWQVLGGDLLVAGVADVLFCLEGIRV